MKVLFFVLVGRTRKRKKGKVLLLPMAKLNVAHMWIFCQVEVLTIILHRKYNLLITVKSCHVGYAKTECKHCSLMGVIKVEPNKKFNIIFTTKMYEDQSEI